MSDDQTLAGNPAPDLETTVSPESVAILPEQTEPQEKPARTFTQEELDAAIGKRLAREQRKWEREQAAKLAEMQVKQPPKDVPSVDQFESTEAYAEALAEKKAIELIEQRERQNQRKSIEEAYAEREEAAREKYDDFEQVVYNPNLPITDSMAEAIQSSDVGPDVAYYLATNIKEADRISRLSPILQAREIGKIEAKLADAPPVKKTTNAPAPISPVTARNSSNPSYDTTDPRSVKNMSTSEWIEAERQRQIKKMQSQNR